MAVMPTFARHHDLKVGINKEVVGKGAMKVAFVELVEDSRCPVDVDCVWAGNAKIKVRVTKNGKSKVIELHTAPMTVLPTYAGYQFKLKRLTPELRSNVRVNRNAYEATLEIISNRVDAPMNSSGAGTVTDRDPS